MLARTSIFWKATAVSIKKAKNVIVIMMKKIRTNHFIRYSKDVPAVQDYQNTSRQMPRP